MSIRVLLLLLSLLAPALPGLAAPHYPVEGFWYNPSEPGNGLSIARKGEVLVIAVYTFGAGGEQVWGLASGDYRGEDFFRAPLVLLVDGSPIEATEHAAGEITEGRENHPGVQLMGSALDTEKKGGVGRCDT